MPVCVSTCATLQLQFGIYSAASAEMCAAREERNNGVVVGSLWYEESDAAQFAGWGVDALHYDNCGQDTMDSVAKMAPMRDAINRTGRPILMMCESFLWNVDPEMRELWSVCHLLRILTTKCLHP